MHLDGITVALRHHGSLLDEHEEPSASKKHLYATAFVSLAQNASFEIQLSVSSAFNWHEADHLLVTITQATRRDVDRVQSWWIRKSNVVEQHPYVFTTWVDFKSKEGTKPTKNALRMSQRRRYEIDSLLRPTGQPSLLQAGDKNVKVSIARGTAFSKPWSSRSHQPSTTPPLLALKTQSSESGFSVADADGWFKFDRLDRTYDCVFRFVNIENDNFRRLSGMAPVRQPTFATVMMSHFSNRLRSSSVQAANHDDTGIPQDVLDQKKEDAPKKTVVPKRVAPKRKVAPKRNPVAKKDEVTGPKQSADTNISKKHKQVDFEVPGNEDQDDEEVLPMKVEPEIDEDLDLPIDAHELPSAGSLSTRPEPMQYQSMGESKERKRKRLMLDLEELEISEKKLAIKRQLMDLD